MRILLHLTLLILPLCAIGQTVVSGKSKVSGNASMGQVGTGADIDFAYRTSIATANGGRYDGLDSQLGAISSTPTSLQYPDSYQSNAGFVSNGSQKLDTTTFLSGTGSTEFVIPYSAGGTLSANDTAYTNAGQLQFNLSLDGSATVLRTANVDGTTVSGPHDWYFQWHWRGDAARLTYNDDISGSPGKKLLIAALNDQVVNSGTFFQSSSCDVPDLVMTDGAGGAGSNIPFLYQKCSGSTNLWLSNSGGGADATLIQNATGCTLGGAGRYTNGPAISSISRTSGTVSFTTASTLGSVTLGTTLVYLAQLPLPSYTSGTSTPLDGVYVLQTHPSGNNYTATLLYQTANPEDVGTFSPSTGNAKVMDADGGTRGSGKCWMLKPNVWEYFQLHVHAGQDHIVGESSPPTDSTVELWAGDQGSPSTLIVSIPGAIIGVDDVAILQTLGAFSDQDSCSNQRISGSGTCSDDTRSAASNDSAWALSTGRTSGCCKAEVLRYDTGRCPLNLPAGWAIPTLTRTSLGGGQYNVAIVLNSSLENGAGTSCYATGQVVTLTGTTIDSGSFNQTFTLSGVSGATLNATRNSIDGGTVTSGAPGGSNCGDGPVSACYQLSEPANSVYCNGGPCNQHEWIEEPIASTKRIPDPGHADGVNLYPDPPNGLTATAGTSSVSLSWTCNDQNGATYKVGRFTGTVVAAETAQSYTQIGTAAACASPYGTKSYTDSTAVTSTQYVYIVKATNATGDSTRSNAATATPN